MDAYGGETFFREGRMSIQFMAGVLNGSVGFQFELITGPDILE